VGVSCFDAKLPSAMRLPLSGITVLSLEQAIAAPLGSRHLADWGACVIKIERPDSGDFARGYDATMHGLSSQFAWAHRSKESTGRRRRTLSSGDRGGGKGSVSGCTRIQDDRDCRQIRLH
jgi:hypothetical protein